jgi:hypothetical protein
VGNGGAGAWSPERTGSALGMMMTLREYSGIIEDEDGDIIETEPRTLHSTTSTMCS